MNGEPRTTKPKRAYSPAVEPLEALRLLSGATATVPTGLVVEQAGLSPPIEASDGASSESAWDAALASARVASLLGTTPATTSPAVDTDADITAGLTQLDRYLSRAWSRAGISPSRQDDCTQAVYLALLQNLGRDRFDAMVRDIGVSGIPDVLSRETPDGPDFFRAIDMVKKRAQRERNAQALDSALTASVRGSTGPMSLQEAIARTLNPRETALIQATLQGETPAEIAEHWGVAPKTVSNEKTRAFQKLREFLTADAVD